MYSNHFLSDVTHTACSKAIACIRSIELVPSCGGTCLNFDVVIKFKLSSDRICGIRHIAIRHRTVPYLRPSAACNRSVINNTLVLSMLFCLPSLIFYLIFYSISNLVNHLLVHFYFVIFDESHLSPSASRNPFV